MSYYDHDAGEYVGFDPVEYSDKRRHKEMYHKSEVKTTQELLEDLYHKRMVEKCKEMIEEPVCDSEDFFDNYLFSFEKMMYDIVGDLHKTLELTVKDKLKNKDEVRFFETDKEHIIRENMTSFIVYQVDSPVKLLGVFFNKEDAENYVNFLKTQKTES